MTAYWTGPARDDAPDPREAAQIAADTAVLRDALTHQPMPQWWINVVQAAADVKAARAPR